MARFDIKPLATLSLSRLEVPAAVGMSLIVQTHIALLAASIPVLAPEIARTSGWNINLIAFYGPLLYLAAFFFSFQVPNLLRRLGGMGLGLACVAFSMVGLLCLLPLTAVLAVATPLAIGAANAAMNPASSQMLGPRTTPRSAGLIMAIKQTGVPLGGVCAGMLVPIFVSRSGWQDTILWLVLGSAVIIVALLPTVSWLNGARTARPPSFRPLEPARQALALPGMGSIIVAAMTFVAAQQCLRSFLTVYLVQSLGFRLEVAGFAFGASQAAGIIGQLLWAFMADRMQRPHFVMALIGGLMSIAGVLTASLTPAWPAYGIVAVAMLYGLTAAGFIPVVFGEVALRAAPERIGALTAGANIFLIVSMLVSPLAFGAIASTISYAGAFVLLAVLALLGSIVAVAAAIRKPRRPGSDA